MRVFRLGIMSLRLYNRLWTRCPCCTSFLLTLLLKLQMSGVNQNELPRSESKRFRKAMQENYIYISFI